jgi:Putative beta barrel porin-7 (BBP7)
LVAAGGGAIPAGTVIAANDQFATSNFFHGLDLGLTGDVHHGPWTFIWSAKLALGATIADVDINGASTATVPGAAPVATAGGLYALPTNIGSFSSTRFAVSPELTAQLGYDISPNVRVFAGYSLLYWTGLVRPGGTIDTTINPTQLGGQPLAGPARPMPQSNTTDYWAQGLNLGAKYKF